MRVFSFPSDIIRHEKKWKNKCVLPYHPATSSIHHKAIFAAAVLDFCVRDGNRYDHCAVITGSSRNVP